MSNQSNSRLPQLAKAYVKKAHGNARRRRAVKFLLDFCPIRNPWRQAVVAACREQRLRLDGLER